MGGWSEEDRRRGSVEQQQPGEAAVSASQAQKTLALFTASALISPEQVCVHGGVCVHRSVCVCTEECVHG